MRSWKTTIAGVLAIVVAAGNAALDIINGKPVDYASVLAAILAGIGLIAARDHTTP